LIYRGPEQEIRKLAIEGEKHGDLQTDVIRSPVRFNAAGADAK
jgi:hypothetical protein